MIIDVNNIDKYYNAELGEFHIDKSKFKNTGDYWSSNSLKPIKGNKEDTYRNLAISFVFNGKPPETTKKVSKFLELIKNCTFKKDNFYYDVEIKEQDIVTQEFDDFEYIQVKFSCYDVYETEKSITTTSAVTVTIDSMKYCYANLELRAANNVISCIVKINDTEITVRNIKGGEVVCIGSGKVTAGGMSKINDVDMREFPRLNPGLNNVSINRQDVSLTVKYSERW